MTRELPPDGPPHHVSVDLSARARDAIRCDAWVRKWHRRDMPTALSDVRFQGQTRKHLLLASISPF